jgi:hypothetical protein
VEELGRLSASKGFRCFREGFEFSFAWRNGYSFGRFLKVAVFTVGGRRGLFVTVVSSHSAGKQIRAVSKMRLTVCFGTGGQGLL